MRSFEGKNPVRIVRKICGLTQAELADTIGCARLTVHTLESGKLKLSHKMAEKISLYTGVSKAWLLAQKHKLPPLCERYPNQPYTVEVFRITQAEISAPRVHPADRVAIEHFLREAFRRLNDAACQAHHSNKIIHFNYTLREFLEQLDRRWPDSGKIPQSLNVAQIAGAARTLLEKGPQKKERSIARKSEGH